MNQPLKNLLFCIFVYCPLYCYGQYDFIEFLSKENGLPVERISNCATDSKGNLWLGTPNGLELFSYENQSVV